MTISNPDLERPKVGQHVRVTSDWSKYLSGWAHWVPRIHVHEGVVRDSASYDELDTFRLYTGDKFDPIKVVCMEYITKIEYIPGNSDGMASVELLEQAAEADKPIVQSFEVQGSKGNTYVVTRTGHKFQCTCPAADFGRNCKHVRQVKKELGFK